MRVYKTTKKSRRTKWLLCFVLPVFCLLVVVFCYLQFVATPIILKSTYAQVDSLATTHISDAIKHTIEKSKYEYSDFVTIKYNSNQEIAAILANSVNINLFAREVVSISQVYLDKMLEQGVDIPIGTFTGLNFLAGRGAKINFRLVPIGSILSSFKSNFRSVGINQTLHSLSVVVETTVTVIMPLTSEKIAFNTEVFICENLIVGKVPSVYLSNDLIK